MRRGRTLLWAMTILAVGLPLARWQWVLRVPTVPSDAATRLSLLMEICPSTALPLKAAMRLPLRDRP